MLRPIQRLLFAALLLLTGCSGLLIRSLPEQSVLALPPGVAVSNARLGSSTGCTLDYRVYDPADGRDGDLVVLAHGFLRSQERMRGLAAAVAASGVRVVTLDFCNTRPWDGRHAQNGLDMIALARHLGAERVVYAGFSAGGLAALIAASADKDAVGVVALDLVETQRLGVRAAKGLDKPLLALSGEPTNCNARGNAGAVLAAADWARVQPIPGASHCDFESPTDVLCELVCTDPNGDAPSGSGGVERRRIIVSATLAVHSLLDQDRPVWPVPAPRIALHGVDGDGPSDR